MSRKREWASRLLGFICVVSGSLMWTGRNTFSTSSNILEQTNIDFTALDGNKKSDITEACESAIRHNGWVIFLVDLDLVADSTPRTYFQTSDEPFGLFIEYDPGEAGLVRLGLGLGPEKWNSSAAIHRVRRNERATFVIGVEKSATRVISSGADQSLDWPRSFAPQWRCDSAEVGHREPMSMNGIQCSGCDTTIFYAAGTDRNQYSVLMDSVSNISEYQFKRIGGSVLLLLGCFIMFIVRARRQS